MELGDAAAAKRKKRIQEMCDSVENLLRQGWTVREGGGEATMQKRWALLPEWEGREPPEQP
jgi:hypothetical protein